MRRLSKGVRRRALVAFSLVMLTHPPAAYALCDAPVVTTPLSQVVSERNPRIEWKAVRGATAYRMRLLSRIPDGRILAAHDTVLAVPGFLAPRPLAELRAKVIVRINAVCGVEASRDTVSAFAIDTSASCAIGEVSAVADIGKAELAWQPAVGAKNYEVRAFTMDGTLLSSTDTRETRARVDLRGHSAVVSVRPACPSGRGDAIYRTIAAD